MTHAPTTARLVLRGHEPRPATLDVEYRSPRTRATKALLSLVGFWVLAPLVFLLPPHIPWGVGAVLAGMYFGYRHWTGEYVVHRFEGSCPRCGSALSLPPGSRIKLPHAMNCYQCHHEPVLEVE